MNTEELKKLGLSEEQVKSVFALHGSVVNGLNQQVSELTTERDDFKTQLTGRDKDLKDLQKQVKDNEELSTQFKDLQNKYTTETEALTQKVAAVTYDNKLKEALGKTKARDTADLAKFLDHEAIKLNDDGSF
ncbi:MAG: phage scaffolding protein, partial [Streptococcaceae bacterium]|nr:phage scaffolding protein [Streptococcaceae bacterium]